MAELAEVVRMLQEFQAENKAENKKRDAENKKRDDEFKAELQKRDAENKKRDDEFKAEMRKNNNEIKAELKNGIINLKLYYKQNIPRSIKHLPSTRSYVKLKSKQQKQKR